MFKKVFIISILFSLIPVLGLAESFPAFPMAFYGKATLNNQNLPAGTEINSFCGDDLMNKISMPEDGVYAYSDSTKNKLLVGECNKDILFKLSDNTKIKYDGNFQAGTTINKDLSFTKTAGPAPSPSGGGGGGGTGGPSSETIEGIKASKGDITGDGKVGKYDFALLMLNWGKKGENSADLNGDGVVNKYDFALLMMYWTG